MEKKYFKLIFFNTINYYISKIHEIYLIVFSILFQKFLMIAKFKIKIIENQKIVEQKIKQTMEWDHVGYSR